MNKNIGDMTESMLKDLIIELQEENSRYERENQKYKKVINKINQLIKKNYYSETDDYYDYFTEGICLQDGDYQDLLDILKEVE